MNQARLSLHIIGIVAYNLHHTVSARLKTQTHFCVSENHVNEPHENHGLIHDILQQAAEGALYLCEICNGIGLRERGSEECAYFGDRLTENRLTDTHPGHTSGRVLTWATDMVSFCSCVWKVSDCSQVLLSFKRILQHLKMGEINLEESLPLHYADAFNKRQSKHSLTGPPWCSTHLWWITADFLNLFSHLPLQERKELELVTHYVKNFSSHFCHVQHWVNQCRQISPSYSLSLGTASHRMKDAVICCESALSLDTTLGQQRTCNCGRSAYKLFNLLLNQNQESFL